MTKQETARFEALEAQIAELRTKIEALSKTRARINVHPAYVAPGAAERRARMQAEIDFRHQWCPAHPGFTKEQLEAAMAEHFSSKAA